MTARGIVASQLAVRFRFQENPPTPDHAKLDSWDESFNISSWRCRNAFFLPSPLLVNASRRETFPARNSRSNVAPKENQFVWTALRDEELRTSIVDKSIDVPWIGLDLL